MSTRKGPSPSATEFKVGVQKKGNDGEMWEVVKNKNNIKYWKRIPKVWGVNKKLEIFWEKLASGKEVVIVYTDGDIETITLPKTKAAASKKFKELENEDDIKWLLTSSMSSDSYLFLFKRAKNITPKEVIKNYKKYFKTVYGKLRFP